MGSNFIDRFSCNQWITIGISILLLVYAGFRAWHVPVVFDEVFTFSNYLVTGGFQPFHARLDANNHLINSALAHLSYLVLGPEPFSLRLPNVLALGLYLYYLFRLREAFTHEGVWLCFFLGLSLIHFLFDFFSLCRGYGLSLAFLTGALFHVWQYAEYRKTWALILALCMLSLALWSNLSLMVVVFSIGGLLLFQTVRFGFPSIRTAVLHLPLFALLFVAPAAYAATYSMALKEAGMLFLGEGVSLDAAIGSGLVSEMFGLRSYRDAVLVSALVMYLIILLVVLLNGRLTWSMVGFHLGIIFAVLGVMALHYALDVNYPTRRAAMHLPWLWLISLFVLLDAMPRNLGVMLAWIPTCLLAGHFVVNMNMNHVIDWSYECVPHSFLTQINESIQQNGRHPIVSCNPYVSSIIGYQAPLSGIESGITCGKVYPSSYADFVITSDGMIWEGQNLYDTADFNAQTGIALMQRREPAKWSLIEEYFPEHDPGQSDYLLFTRLERFHEFDGKAISVEISMTARSSTNPMIWSLYSQVWGDENECLEVNEGDAQIFFDLGMPRRIHIRAEAFPASTNADHMRLFIQPHDRKNRLELSNIHIAIYAANE